MLLGKAKGSNKAKALVLGTGEAISNDNGAANDIEATFKNLRHADGATGRLREPDGPHRRSNSNPRASNTIGS